MAVYLSSAARHGETKFHDPSRAIYLNRASHVHKPGGGFLLERVGAAGGNVAGNRLANGYVQGDRGLGAGVGAGWRYSAALGVGGGRQQQPREFDASEVEKLKPSMEQPADEQVGLSLLHVCRIVC